MDNMEIEMDRDTQLNHNIATAYWLVFLGLLGLGTIIRVVNFFYCARRLKSRSNPQSQRRPRNAFEKAWGTVTTALRRLRYPQVYVSLPYISWMTPPPLGRILFLMAYWIVIIVFMCYNSIEKDIMYYERIGFRNAWITVTQVPMLYLLSQKASIIDSVSGISYERLNWLHRWVARTMFVTASVHGWHFWTMWAGAGILDFMMRLMTQVKFGLTAWAILLWMVITGFKPVRSVSYEVFLIQHVIVAVTFLWVVYRHVPDKARWAVWAAIVSISWDRALRIGLLLMRNIKFRPSSTYCDGQPWIGHRTQVTSVGDSSTVVTIHDVHFKYKAGQHVYLWIPRVGPCELHPYTIASSLPAADVRICNSIQLVIRSHSGFSMRLNKFSRSMQSSESRTGTVTSFVAGPYGRAPRWSIYETVILIAASTGASFTLPVLDSILQASVARETMCTRRVYFLLTAKKMDHMNYYHERLQAMIIKGRSAGIELTVHIAMTESGEMEEKRQTENHLSSSDNTENDSQSMTDPPAVLSQCPCGSQPADANLAAPQVLMSVVRNPSSTENTTSTGSIVSGISYSGSRQNMADFIRVVAEKAEGESGVIVCGGPSLVASVRTAVAALNGKTPYGIHLHAEEYSF